ncbi:YadA-like family protein [Phyllobacterium sp. TAF24]|uniref:YadA-like family protein n=1 Tax=Phyllobacterium sp. TAF24 TaxID=3233068 RepID=UPI003F99AD36
MRNLKILLSTSVISGLYLCAPASAQQYTVTPVAPAENVVIGNGASANNVGAKVGPTGQTVGGGPATALGNHAQANGGASTAVGYGAVAGDPNATGIFDSSATAIGSIAKATGDGSTAIGNGTTASGAVSTAIGFGANADSTGSVAIGHFANATGTIDPVTGGLIVTQHKSGAASVAIGSEAKSAGDQSIALGQNSNAVTNGSVALGNGSVSDRALAPSTGNAATVTGAHGAVDIKYNTTDKKLAGAVSIGDGDTYRQLTNLADGSAATDAVNVRQLQQSLQAGINYTDVQVDQLQTQITNQQGAITNIQTDVTDIKNVNIRQDQTLNNHEVRITKNEGDIVNIKGDITDIQNVNIRQDQTLNDHEVRITKNEGDIVDIKNVNIRQDTTLNNHEVRITKNEGDIAGIQDGAVFYNRDANGVKTGGVTFNDGSGKPVKLGNVAAGTADTDGVNVRQLKDVRSESFAYTDNSISQIKNYTDNRLSNLSGDIRSVRKEARSGIASATAMAGLRYDDRPGKGSIAAGLGGFKSATSIAAGVGYTTENGRFRLNASLGYGFEDSSAAWNAGASWTFN